MPNIVGVIRDEIRRIAGRHMRSESTSLKKRAAQHRREIAALKRQVATLVRRLSFLERQEKKRISRDGPAQTAEGSRYSPRWVKAHRAKLKLSAAEYAKLIGVSPLTVYNWEHGKSKPRQQQLAAWQAVRRLGKREALRRLEMRGK